MFNNTNVQVKEATPLQALYQMFRRLMIILASVIGVIVLLLLLHWSVWSFIPPIPTHALAKAGHFVTVQGINTYYETQGTGSPLILIPPGASHTSTWRNNIGYLSQKYQVWTLDLPGSGYSEKPATFAYTHAAYAAFINAFMETMNIHRAVVAGQSLGGTVALEFSLDYPDKTAGLILIDSGGYPQTDKPTILSLNRYQIFSAIVMSFSSYPFVVKSFLNDLYYDPTPFQNDTKWIAELCAINRTPNSRAAWYWMPRALNWSFALPDPSRIRAVAAPTLIIWGNNDKVVSVNLAHRFQQDIKNASLTIIDKAGHTVHEEQPEAVNRAIMAFLLPLKW